jgi:Tfp pilus assembly protein PilO
MSRLSARTQIIIAIVVIAALAVAFIVFAILPLITSASDVDAQIDQANTNLATAQALLARRQSAKAQSAQNEVELIALANEVPDTPQLPSVIIELQDVANAAGLEFPQITVGDLTPGQAADGSETSDYSAVPLTVVVRGEWADVIEYCGKLYELERGVRITSSSHIYVPETETSEAYVQGTIELEVYVMAAAESPSTSGTAAPSTEATETP